MGVIAQPHIKSITQPADNGLFAVLSFINVDLLPIAPKKKVLIEKNVLQRGLCAQTYKVRARA